MRPGPRRGLTALAPQRRQRLGSTGGWVPLRDRGDFVCADEGCAERGFVEEVFDIAKTPKCRPNDDAVFGRSAKGVKRLCESDYIVILCIKNIRSLRDRAFDEAVAIDRKNSSQWTGFEPNKNFSPNSSEESLSRWWSKGHR